LEPFYAGIGNDELEWFAHNETLRMNERGVPVDIPLIKKTIQFLEKYQSNLIEECEELTGGIVPTRVGELTKWLNDRIAIPNLQRLTLERAIKEHNLDEDVKQVIRIRLEMGRVSTKKLYAMLARSNGGRVRGSFIYHGAGPGRFTAMGVQFHNFQRPTIKNVNSVIARLVSGDYVSIIEEYGDRTLEAIGSCMRGFIKAPKRYRIIRADYSAIEARVLLWLAKEFDAVLLFHKGEDIYCDMASDIFGKSAADIRARYDAGELRGAEERKLGKDSVLGCGYQMGVLKFLLQLENKGSDDIAGVPIRDDPNMRGVMEKSAYSSKAWWMGCKAVYGYRDKYSGVKKLWSLMEKAAIAAIENKGKVFHVNRKIKFKYEKDSLVMKLPSGRKIFYPYMETFEDTDFNGNPKTGLRFKVVNAQRQWAWEYTYGGKLVENAVQAIARDLMVNGMHHAAAAGYQLIATVHDEIIALMKKRNVRDDTVLRFEKLICRLPAWAIGKELHHTIPLAAEGVVSVRYGK
jgi:DNA polymerase